MRTRLPSSLASLVALAFAALPLTVTSSAFAQDPGAPPAPSTSATAEAVVESSSPRPPAAAPETRRITATCSLGSHPGIDDAEALTAADVICHELARQSAPGPNEVRFGKLGGRTLVVVTSAAGEAHDEKRTLLTGIDEIHVAAPRLVRAIVENKAVDETKDVDNVLAAETRQPKIERGVMGFDGGLFGTTTVGVPSDVSAGLALGLLYRSKKLGISAQGRAGGISGSLTSNSGASLDVGARYYFLSSGASPFIGGGLGISHFNVSRPSIQAANNDYYSMSADLSGAGFGGYAIVGAEILRSHHMGLSAAIRADTPFYSLGSELWTSTGRTATSTSRYVVPISLNVGVLFH